MSSISPARDVISASGHRTYLTSFLVQYSDYGRLLVRKGGFEVGIVVFYHFSSLVISCFFAAIVVFAEVTPILLDFKVF
jgi:hypothetical protein